MITIEELKNNGADVNTGLSRCVGKEDLYLKLVNMGLGDANLKNLESPCSPAIYKRPLNSATRSKASSETLPSRRFLILSRL